MTYDHTEACFFNVSPRTLGITARLKRKAHGRRVKMPLFSVLKFTATLINRFSRAGCPGIQGTIVNEDMQFHVQNTGTSFCWRFFAAKKDNRDVCHFFSSNYYPNCYSHWLWISIISDTKFFVFSLHASSTIFYSNVTFNIFAVEI